MPFAFADRFIIDWRAKLGEGAFSRVYECIDADTAEVFAVKVIDLRRCRLLRSFSMQKLLREAHILQALQHPNIVKLHSVFPTPTAVWLVQELAHGTELFRVIVRDGKLSEASTA